MDTDLQACEVRFLHLGDVLPFTTTQLLAVVTQAHLPIARKLLAKGQTYECPVVHYSHHWPMSQVTIQVQPEEQVTWELKLALACDALILRRKPLDYPHPLDCSSWATWSGVALSCPGCGLMIHAPGLDPDDDPVGPYERARDLYHRHFDETHREPKEAS